MCLNCTPFATSPSVLDCLGTGVAAMLLATFPLSDTSIMPETKAVDEAFLSGLWQRFSSGLDSRCGSAGENLFDHSTLGITLIHKGLSSRARQDWVFCL
jgi:hypothetical protein